MAKRTKRAPRKRSAGGRKATPARKRTAGRRAAGARAAGAKRKSARGTKKASTAARSAGTRSRKAARGGAKKKTTRRSTSARSTGRTSTKRAPAKSTRRTRTRAVEPTPPPPVAPPEVTTEPSNAQAAPSRRRRAPKPATESQAPDPAEATGEEEEGEDLVPGAPSSLARDYRGPKPPLDDDLEEALEVPPDSPGAIRAGDVDVDVNSAYSSGEEAPGGDNPTPDQDVVDLIGRAVGVEYADNEELRGAEKISERDRHRWELDPASSEDYKDRTKS